jgi:hypothetical protein
MKTKRKRPIRRRSKCKIEDDPALKIIGLGHSGKGDLAERHDYYLARRLRKKGH